MFVLSVKADKKKLLWIVCAAAVLAVLLIVFFGSRGQAVQTAAGYQLQAQDNAGRKAFLAQFGWEVSDEPTEICEVIIPDTFDDVYQKYNDLQKTQEFDLTRYQGRRVKRWTYEVKNYPDYEGTVVANLLVYNNEVIGGDVCSHALDGFMQGFRRNSQPIELPAESTAQGTSSASSESSGVSSTAASCSSTAVSK